MIRVCAIAMVAVGMCGCGGDSSAAIAPSPIATPVAPAPVLQGSDGALYGVVTAVTADGRAPLGGVELEVAVCPKRGFAATEFVHAVTGADGTYRVLNMCSGQTYVWMEKAGYTTQPNLPPCDGGCLYVSIDRETRFDIEMVKQ